jgi:Zn finger protein HypA/HybF involved in hydrogenase expression
MSRAGDLAGQYMQCRSCGYIAKRTEGPLPDKVTLENYQIRCPQCGDIMETYITSAQAMTPQRVRGSDAPGGALSGNSYY